MASYLLSSTWICLSVIVLGLYVVHGLYMYHSTLLILDLVGTVCVIDLSIANRF